MMGHERSWQIWTLVHNPTEDDPVLVWSENLREHHRFPTIQRYLGFLHDFWPRLVFRAERTADGYTISSRFKGVDE